MKCLASYSAAPLVHDHLEGRQISVDGAHIRQQSQQIYYHLCRGARQVGGGTLSLPSWFLVVDLGSGGQERALKNVSIFRIVRSQHLFHKVC